jgi:formylglycine-generating enzyme required for sulfatase activity
MPQHTLPLQRYYIARYPVTVAQFHAFVEASGYRPDDEDSLRGIPNHPVVNVPWHDALAYCKWLTRRLREWAGTPEPLATLLQQEDWQVTLPSEAEWEKAARGLVPDSGEGRIYPWGDKFAPDKANTEETDINGTSTVGCFPKGKSPYGVMDLSGNVFEWTRSVFADYSYPNNQKAWREQENLEALRDQPRVLRGGAFWGNQWDARCAFRNRNYPAYRDVGVGFRVVVLPKL